MTIKRIIIPKGDLPYKNAFTDEYFVRYRLISDDRNKFSHWSPVFPIIPQFYYSSSVFSISKQSTHVSLIWDPVKVKLSQNADYYDSADTVDVEKEYDVWIRWSKADLGDWRFYSRIEGSSININIPNEYFYNGEVILDKPNQISVEIRKVANPIVRVATVPIFYSITNETV